jgi:hypothetical protein
MAVREACELVPAPGQEPPMVRNNHLVVETNLWEPLNAGDHQVKCDQGARGERVGRPGEPAQPANA